MKTTQKATRKKTVKATKTSTRTVTKKKKKGKPGRPKTPIDMRLAKKLMGKYHTQEDISDIMEISVDTLMRNALFAEAYKRNTVAAKTSIRAGLYKYALKGDATLLKFMAKNILHMSENPVDMDERKIAEPIKIILAHSIKPPVYRRPPKVDENVVSDSDYEDDNQ